MQALFRTDASYEIGSGHVMRCLTLANALKGRKYKCIFITKEHDGNLIEFIISKGFEVISLKTVNHNDKKFNQESQNNLYSKWLNDSNEKDAKKVIELIKPLGKFDFIFVDHYGIDKKWEVALKPYTRKIIVIDDLANREHDCNVLIDQTLYRNINDYKALVNNDCEILSGSKYAILRPEFATYRQITNKNKTSKRLIKIMISLGGYDENNLTGFILDEIKEMNLDYQVELDVVINKGSPYFKDLKNKAADMKTKVEILESVENMAEVMSNNDICVGAAGTTAWERCCIGLPTIIFIMADNQIFVAKSLEDSGAAYIVKDKKHSDFRRKLLKLINNKDVLERMRQSALSVTDGRGVNLLLRKIIN